MIEDKIDECDLKLSQISGCNPHIHKVQRLYNPLKVYHELVSSGMPKRTAEIICRVYEDKVYNLVSHYYKMRACYEQEDKEQEQGQRDSPSYNRRLDRPSYP
jgi:hypothetical protein